MRVEKEHNTAKADAISIIDNYLRNLLTEPLPAGFRIINPRINLDNNIMHFSFDVRSLILNVSIHGTIEVNDSEAILDIELPQSIINILGEGNIIEGIMRYFDDMFD